MYAIRSYYEIIGDSTDNEVQAYFVYDSKKAGSMTTSHLRFGKKEIRAPYLITSSDFVACHNFSRITSYNVCYTKLLRVQIN